MTNNKIIFTGKLINLLTKKIRPHLSCAGLLMGGEMFKRIKPRPFAKNLVWAIFLLFMEFVVFVNVIQATVDKGPIELNVTVSDFSQISKGYIYVNTKITTIKHFANVKINAQPISGGQIIEPAEISINDLLPDRESVIKQKIKLIIGKSEISVSAKVFDPDNKLSFERVIHFYIIWDGNGLFSGTSGFTNLIIEKLKKELSQGKITKKQYQYEIDKLLGDGAIENN